MNVLFITSYREHRYNKNKPAVSHFQTQPGISSIAAVLKSEGHKVELFVVCGNTPLAMIDRTIEEFKPGVIGFTAVYSEYDFALKIAKRIRDKNPGLFLIAGGVHVTLNPETAAGDGWNAICVGEGEYPMVELVNRLESGQPWENIENLWCKTASGIQKNSCRPFIEDLSKLPFPDRTMWMPWVPANPAHATILLGRGCPFPCTYCCNHALRKIAKGKYVRIRSPEHVMGEVNHLLDIFPGLTEIRFEIETIGIHEDVMMELAQRLKTFNQTRENPLTFTINLRIIPGHDFGQLLHALKAANFTSVDIGLESGSELVRKKYLRRDYSNDDVRHAVSHIRQAGLKAMIYVLVGIPGESYEDYLKTEDFLRELQPDGFASYIVFPYPGTAIYQNAKEQGLLSNNPDIRSERARATLNLPGFPAKKIERCFDWLPYKVYKGHKPTLYLLLWVIDRKLCRLGWFGLKYY